jgi:tRNA pseudouridine38-40 synthase
MPTWKMKIEYDGGRYSGWQQQENGRTIQGELLKVANHIFADKVEIGGAGRTDAGVHALEQVAHLRTKNNLPVKELLFHFNQLLPKDIHLLNIELAGRNFDARHDAISRCYLYQISTRRTAFGKAYVWWVKDRLNVKAMQQVCDLLIGLRDFRSFCEIEENKSTLVKVEDASLTLSNSLILFRISASHFLWKMVRRIVGTLVEIGRGNIKESQLIEFLTNYSPKPAIWTAPPSGLLLEKVIYPGDPKPKLTNPMLFIS